MRTLRRRSLPYWSLVAVLTVSTPVHGESGRAAWLRYAPLPAAARERYATLPRVLVSLDDSPVLRTASSELARGITAMAGGTTSASARLHHGSAIVLGTVGRVRTVV